MLKLRLAILPLVFFTLLIGFLWRGLSLDPKNVPSALVDKPVPTFSLPDMLHPNQTLNSRDFKGHVSLVHVFASWCQSCRQEQPVIAELAKKAGYLYGLDYKDEDTTVITWLHHLGNPYVKIGSDHQGSAALDWGVYGTPELFVVDKKGVIRYKHIGVLDKKTLHAVILPLVKQLKEEA